MAQVLTIATLLFLCTAIDDVTGIIYDLSHVHRPSSFVFDDMPSFNRTAVFQGILFPKTDTYVDTGYFITSEHSGTHMDVPAHMFPGRKTLADITVEMSIADGVMIDCSDEAKENQSYAVPLKKLLDWEEEHGRIPQLSAVIFNFGWSKKFEDHVAYRGSPTSYDFPYISEEAGVWLYEKRDAKMIGMDTFSPDSMNPSDGNRNVIHKTFLGNDRLIVENLKDPGHLPPRGFRFYAVPAKYEGATATQLRAFAVTFDEDVFYGGGQGHFIRPSLMTLTFLMLILKLVH